MKRTVKAEIIGVGTELLLGQIANTNAQWISSRLAAQGINVYYHSVVGDNLDRCAAQFRESQHRSDVIIVTGGLGPTEDDMTRDAAKLLFGRELVEDKASMERIESFYDRNNRTMSPNNRRQSLVFRDSIVLQNHEGMAPGMIVHHEGVVWVFLPGVPGEMKHLMENHVLPHFSEQFGLETEIVSEMLRFIGIGESQLEHELYDIIQKQTNPTLAPLASEGEVGLRITAKADSRRTAEKKIKTVKNRILSRVGEFYYGSDEITIQEKVVELLTSNNKTVTAAESLTGGRFIEQIVSIPGASKICHGGVIAYSADMKKEMLKVPSFLIKKYGTVSEECASAMALNAQSLVNSDIAISFTGVAGPETSEGKDPGTVYISLQMGEQEPITKKFQFAGGRETVRTRAVKKGFELLFHNLKKA
ncbi:competence/damage-inducible protein A [Thalassobacillus pellis]|uniref:competence/damage-inducible protein A n=1 Tax=Thalassobacillus pellis TaxID=748008 RepID=UPI00195F984E|nr:competence/damage-inducible protein A [Thalassobacillus pellis]MBM7552679.1 nicotinamide-nucleotide amidase [Thalassobacillus pellis]